MAPQRTLSLSPLALARRPSSYPPPPVRMKVKLRSAHNLGTCDFETMPPTLHKIWYPLDANSGIIGPSQLAEYMERHLLPYPRCMCSENPFLIAGTKKNFL
ncbi:hypothetical protein GLOTRDRAFT_127312 [Gloeophyllum trabeum ATCC 11539]|uniref:Uncharacterized protein n=1 Tax=Gloeophyllum trabeum (strain ATCC 11539 / FP-39264 / Madison 617) TaxID=670483 RepID=S7QAI2_GLOTA|nr:uncharacterized protein GLOTRDRAFT_127312 [Gloeophyllum trabeum ATCC 11539]EPQ56926.1 hypothetical protein GLOTRDRAFT_127312 [Gloeophyllum trabeum ATCC 11539]